MESIISHLVVYGIIGLALFIGVMFVINFMKNTRAAFVVRNKRKEMPVFSIEDIGREYVALGVVKSSNTFYQRAEVELIEQAQKMGADAIVGCNGESRTSTSGRVDKGILNISNDPRHYSVKTDSTTTYSFYGTAVKFL